MVGDDCVVEADIFRDGHEVIRAAVKWRRKQDTIFDQKPMVPVGNDRWRGQFTLQENTRYVFTIEAWTDRYASWIQDFVKKAAAQRDVSSDLLEGVRLLQELSARTAGSVHDTIATALANARECLATRPADAADFLAAAEIDAIAAEFGERFEANSYSPLIEIVVDRPRARFGAWYEIFPRSLGKPGQPGTLRSSEHHLPYIRDLGFDVVYLTPIHPIGQTNRKGANNRLAADGSSPGSPWAIGNPAGGHMAIEPSLGTLADFDHFVTTANRLGLDVALDFAIQASPDHPWVHKHPEWFRRRPDGSIKYAENPPKEYQDIYPINFDTDQQHELMEELLTTVMFWVKHGVKIFRVDNPHTKPVRFWEWLIGAVQERHPEVIFLSEAFTRPKMMKALAKAGFSQSYTYFTWRNSKFEISDYLTELAHSEMSEYFRPNFFVNTPDILTDILQRGGRPAFKMRLVLAATLSPSYGIYSGYELCENAAVPGTEEYQDSEKYQIKSRDWDLPGNIKEFIALLNRIRNRNPALQQLSNVEFLPADNDQILFYAKSSADRGNVLLIAVNLDPWQWHECTVTIPPAVVGTQPGQSYRVIDQLTGSAYTWGERNYVRLEPQAQPAHIMRVERGR
ncbi:MAG: alpha-1,4-glucan--maltose-1-phosphate maltosyltransferase [Deltaproteobacteria bacterium]|nr:alpha-1,4-glucan--maltose-1-phosphate maltosyltransferase [Deltaproteobacteria bacterium]